MVIEKSLQRPISVNAHDKQFVQCVSPNIAEQAGVGIGTLYRHFPQRSDLIAAVFRRR